MPTSPGPHELSSSFNERGPHNEIPIGIHQHPVPCPLVQAPESPCPGQHVLQTCQLLSAACMLASCKSNIANSVFPACMRPLGHKGLKLNVQSVLSYTSCYNPCARKRKAYPQSRYVDERMQWTRSIRQPHYFADVCSPSACLM